jgi:hypothetical protein
MKNLKTTLAGTTLTLLTLVAPATATTYTFSGQYCVGDEQTLQRDHIVYNSLGAYCNYSNTDYGCDVSCPIGGFESTTIDVTAARVRVYDAHNYRDVECGLSIKTQSGTLYWATPRYSCQSDTTNGCLTEENSGQGIGYYGIAWSGDVLHTGGSPISSAMAYSVGCWIPGHNQGTCPDCDSGDSYVIGYEVTQSAD